MAQSSTYAGLSYHEAALSDMLRRERAKRLSEQKTANSSFGQEAGSILRNVATYAADNFSDIKESSKSSDLFEDYAAHLRIVKTLKKAASSSKGAAKGLTDVLASAGMRYLTRRALKRAWQLAPETWFISIFLYGNLHIFGRFVMGEKYFCKPGHEWGPKLDFASRSLKNNSSHGALVTTVELAVNLVGIKASPEVIQHAAGVLEEMSDHELYQATGHRKSGVVSSGAGTLLGMPLAGVGFGEYLIIGILDALFIMVALGSLIMVVITWYVIFGVIGAAVEVVTDAVGATSSALEIHQKVIGENVLTVPKF